MGLLNSILGAVAAGALRRGGVGFGRAGGRNRLLMALLPVFLGMLRNSRGGPSLGMLAGLGGLGALLQQLQQQGYGHQVQSWIGTGANEPIPPDALSQVFDSDQLSQIALQAGITEDEARAGLSELLPEIVDHFTPQGSVPDFDQLAASVNAFEQQLQQGGPL